LASSIHHTDLHSPELPRLVYGRKGTKAYVFVSRCPSLNSRECCIVVMLLEHKVCLGPPRPCRIGVLLAACKTERPSRSRDINLDERDKQHSYNQAPHPERPLCCEDYVEALLGGCPRDRLDRIDNSGLASWCHVYIGIGRFQSDEVCSAKNRCELPPQFLTFAIHLIH
jgi:hypothetical protein